MIRASVCSVRVMLEASKTLSRVFSGFVTRSIVSRVMSILYPELFVKTHDKGVPSVVYLSPLMDIEKGSVLEHLTRSDVYVFTITSLTVNSTEIGKELLAMGTMDFKDFKAEFLDMMSTSVTIKPMHLSEEDFLMVKFLSPSSFRMTPLKGRLERSVYFPFPRPDLLIKSALRTLRSCVDEKTYSKIISSWDPLSLRLVRFQKMKTKVYYDFRERPYVAFKGEFLYKIDSPKPYDLLFPLAKITGLGAWRFSGFGRVSVHVLDDDELRNII